MTTAVPDDRQSGGVAWNLNERWRRISRAASMLACTGAALLVGYQHFVPPKSPGDIIRSELKAAAAEMGSQLVLAPNQAVLAAIRRDFSGQDVGIATVPSSPIIAVTLHGVDRAACVEAVAKVRRINGSVVVMLQGYGAAEDCSSRNDMTWWIMP
jgi:hypothetical protein